MRPVADESVDFAIVVRLREDGHEVLAVSEWSPAASDEAVLTLASGSLLLTADKDFGELIFRRRRSHSGALLLRLAGLPASDKAGLAPHAIRDHGAAITGSFAVLSSGNLRIKTTPIR